jgi:hypothetical protein
MNRLMAAPKRALVLMDTKTLDHLRGRGLKHDQLCPTGIAINGNGRDRRIFLGLMGKSLEDAIAFIEDLSGEKLTPEEIEELRRTMCDDEHWRPNL